MALLITPGTTAATSADFTLASGESTTLYLSGSYDHTCFATVLVRTSSGSYPVAYLSGNDPLKVVVGAGTFAVERHAGAVSFGVDRD